MGLQFGRTVGVALEIGTIGIAFAEQHMHDAAGEGTVGAGAQDDFDIGLLHGVIVVDVDSRDPGAAFLARTAGVGHHVDLGIHRICAPDDDQVGDPHFARIDAGNPPGADGESDACDVGAYCGIEPGVFLDMGESVDAVAHDNAHRPGIIMRPHQLRAETSLRRVEPRRDLVKRLVPRNPRELTRPLRSRAAMRIDQPIRMVDAFGVPADLGADHTRGIGLQLGTAYPPDRGIVDHLDVQRAGRWAIMWTGGMPDLDLGALVHGGMNSIKSAGLRDQICPPNRARSHVE